MKKKPPIYPLNLFYDRGDIPFPEYKVVDGQDVPQPAHEILVHFEDMTPTLESFYGRKIFLTVLEKYLDTHHLIRKVLLHCGDGVPVVFGAIDIHLSRFDEPVREEILACRKPLGMILYQQDVVHRSRPQLFFQVQSDTFMNEALGLTQSHQLYGRVNRLETDQSQSLVEVVEILPPFDREA